jgi:hypothetical protein
MGLKITLGLSKWARITIAIVNKKRSSAEMIDCLTAVYSRRPEGGEGRRQNSAHDNIPFEKKKKTPSLVIM